MKYDLLANFEEIKKRRGLDEQDQLKLHYVGHSQGAVVMMAALADPDEETREKIEAYVHRFYALAPVIYTVMAKPKQSFALLSEFIEFLQPVFLEKKPRKLAPLHDNSSE